METTATRHEKMFSKNLDSNLFVFDRRKSSTLRTDTQKSSHHQGDHYKVIKDAHLEVHQDSSEERVHQEHPIQTEDSLVGGIISTGFTCD